MTKPAGTDGDRVLALVRQARQHLRQGAPIKAMQNYCEAHELDPASTAILVQLVAINLHLELVDQAIVNLQKLIALEPSNPEHYDRLATVYDRVREWDRACQIYQPLILKRPKLPEAHFNLAYYLRRAGRFDESMESYRRALANGIRNPEEAHLNIAVILSDDLRRGDAAERELTRALAINENFLPALYSLANLREERGDRNEAIELLERMLSADSRNAKALARLIPLVDDSAALIKRLEAVSEARDASVNDRIDALYALGKTRDADADYDQAFEHYKKANELNATQMRPYDRAGVEVYFNRIIDTVSAIWVGQHARDGDEQPIFVCGMFCSGTTLVDRILGSHPDITAGGERNDLVREFNPPRLRYPEGLANIASRDLHGIAARYAAQTEKIFPQAALVTNERPDNFVYIGVLKALFPKAKFVYAVRQPLDNCLSVYFLRLGPAMNYAVNLDDIAHYYDQQARFREHWQSMLGDELHIVDYGQLVENPRPGVEALLDYVGVDWHDDCLNFHELANTATTGSVRQVRQPPYATSSGRWRNYEMHLAGLIRHYGTDGAHDD